MGTNFFGFLASLYIKNAQYRLEKILFSIFSLKRDISTAFVTTTLDDIVDFCSFTQKLGYYQHFDFFIMSKTDPTYAAPVKDVPGQDLYGSAMVIVTKMVRMSFFVKKR